MKFFRSLFPIIGTVSLLGLIACSTTKPPQAENVPTDSSASSNDRTASPDARVITIEAKDFAFDPATIQVRKGEKAVVKITSTEGDHAFSIPDLDIGFQPVLAGQTITVAIPTDRAGSFQVICGPMHPDMLGTLVVQE